MKTPRVLALRLLVLTGLLALAPRPAPALSPLPAAARYFTVHGGAALAQGIAIVRVSDGKLLFSHAADTPLCPASLTKLATTAALLYYFGPAETLSTRIYYQGKRSPGKIEGDLVIVGDGDPLMVSETLWQIAADLKNLGIKQISGQLVLDNQLFDEEWRDSARELSAATSNHAYDAPLTAFGVNFNTLALAIAPGDRRGIPARVGLDPYPVEGVVIDNRLRTVASKAPTRVQVTRVSLADGRAKLVVTGQIAEGSALRKVYRSVNDPLIASGEYVRAFLKAQGITLAGKTRAGHLPAHAQLLLHRKSQPMAAIVQSLNLYSNNYIADVMVKRLGAAFPPKEAATGSRPGSYTNGMRLVSDFLASEVHWSSDFVLKNGSGLDAENRTSAAALGNLLAYMAKRWDLFPDYIVSLPNAGLTGTLHDRFKSGPAAALKGLVRAKTGTLSEPIMASNLAGYVHHASHGLLAFAILQNGLAGQRQPSILEMHASQERGLYELLKTL